MTLNQLQEAIDIAKTFDASGELPVRIQIDNIDGLFLKNIEIFTALSNSEQLTLFVRE